MGFAHPWIMRAEGEVVGFPTERESGAAPFVYAIAGSVPWESS